MSDVIFEAGDVVTCAFYGDREFVLKMSNLPDYPVCFLWGEKYYFTSNGRQNISHTSPVLKLVRKKIKKRNIKEIFRVKSDNGAFLLDKDFDSYDDALDWIKGNGVNEWVYSIDKLYKVNDL